MATLVIAGALGAIMLCLWEEGDELIAIYSFGGILEARAIDRARNAIRDVRAPAPQTATLVRNCENEDVPVGSVNIGDMIRIMPGSLIPLDGVVSEGNSAVDESYITGELFQVENGSGAGVYAGTMNRNGSLIVQVTSKTEDSTVSQVI